MTDRTYTQSELAAQVQAAQVDMRERAAQVLINIVSKHRAVTGCKGPEGFCEDFGCTALEEYAAAIRALPLDTAAFDRQKEHLNDPKTWEGIGLEASDIYSSGGAPQDGDRNAGEVAIEIVEQHTIVKFNERDALITALDRAVAEKVKAAESATARQILSKAEYDVWELDHDGHGIELAHATQSATVKAYRRCANHIASLGIHMALAKEMEQWADEAGRGEVSDK